ncbi:MAG: hypothetical protein ACRCRZ_01065 [Metamycoplasmataceae bacterium]
MSLKRKLLLSTLAVSPVIATTALVISCSQIPYADTSLSEQNNMLKSEGAKKYYKKIWVEQTFANFYIKEVLNTSVTSNKINAIMKFLGDLTTKDTNIDFEAKQDDNTPISNSQVYDNLYQSLFGAYQVFSGFESNKNPDFFVQKFNTDSSASENPGWSDYYMYKYDEQEQNLILSTETIGEYFQLGQNSRGYSYLVNADTPEKQAWNKKFEEDFKKLYWVDKTEIKTKILEMSLTYLYFTQASEAFVKGGTNYNELKNATNLNPTTIQAWELSNFKLDNNYFFVKYLVEKTPVIKWSLTTQDQDGIENITSKLSNGLYTKEDFDFFVQNLRTSVGAPMNQNLKIMTNDTIFNSLIDTAKGFVTSDFNSSFEVSSGDLLFKREQLIYNNKEKSGFVNQFNTGHVENTNNLYSFDQLQAMYEIKNNFPQFTLPKITLKNTATGKVSTKITQEDLLIESSINSTGKLNIEKVYPILNNDEREKITVIANIKFQDKTGKEHTYNFDANITWIISEDPNKADVIADLAKIININNELPSSKYFISGLKVFPDKTKVGLDYYIRLVPNFEWNIDPISNLAPIISIENKKYILGEFNLKGISWATEEGIKKLSYLFYLQDSSLFEIVREAFVWNDYAFSALDETLVSVLNELKISKLSTSERNNKKLSTAFISIDNINGGNLNISVEDVLNHLNKNETILNYNYFYEDKKRQ